MEDLSKRQDVYKAIDSEREYQEIKWDHDSDASIAEFLLYIEHHLSNARENAYYNDLSALEQIRKIAALGVACMEQHGAPQRKI